MIKYNMVFGLFCCICFSCQNGMKIHSSENKGNKEYEWSIGKTINSVDSILPSGIFGNKVLFLFNFHDCDPCVDAGFHTMKKIDETNGNPCVYPIVSMANPAVYQMRNEYYDYIYSDDKDLIRKELKFIPTPVMLLMDSENKIIEVYFPKDTLNDVVFRKKCMKMLAL